MLEFSDLYLKGELIESGTASELFHLVSLPQEESDLEKISYLINQNNFAPEKYKFSYFITDKNNNSLFHYLAKNNYLHILSDLVNEIKRKDKDKAKDKGKEKASQHSKPKEKTSDKLCKIMNTKNEDGMTPLYWACEAGNVEVINFLISLGADIFIRNNDNDELLTFMLNNLQENEPEKVKVIKILLAHQVGLGCANLSQIIHDKNLQFEPGIFGDVNVIGSGITREDSGFEFAICDLTNFIEEIVPDSEKNRPENLQVNFNLGEKRLKEIDPENESEKVTLIKFLKRLDFLMPGSLFRLCLRYVAENIFDENSEKLRKSLKELELPFDMIQQIKNEISYIDHDILINDMDNILRRLTIFLKSLEAEKPLLDAELSTVTKNYSIAFKTFISSLIMTFFLIGTALGYSVYAGDLSNDLTFDLLTASLIAISISIFIGVCWCSGIFEFFNTEFGIRVENLKKEFVDNKKDIEDILISLHEKEMISQELLNIFLNVKTLPDLIEATENIILRCKLLISLHTRKASIFYQNRTQTFFKEHDAEPQSDEDTIIELTDEADTTNIATITDPLLSQIMKYRSIFR